MTDFAEKRKAVEEIDNLNSEQFNEFLDNSQYLMNGILRYEKIFGRGFISTGGLTTTKEVVAKIGLKKGDQVLSVGCGIGGGECYMHKEYGVTVHGIDLSRNMLAVARYHVEILSLARVTTHLLTTRAVNKTLHVVKWDKLSTVT